RYRRTGTLWEGRYKSCLVDSDTYLLQCYRYIELNPLRAGMVAHPEAYPWSSFLCNGLGVDDPLVRPHTNYLSLGATSEERLAAYRSLVMEVCNEDEVDQTRRHLQQQHALGSARFRFAIEAQLARRAGPAKIGRPEKAALDGESAL